MTELNFKELLQVEIDKVQGYVDSKKEAITIAEFNLLKDKNQLTDLEVKLKDLLDKKAELEEFEEWKNSKKTSAKEIGETIAKTIKSGKATGGKVSSNKGEVNAAEGVFTGVMAENIKVEELNLKGGKE